MAMAKKTKQIIVPFFRVRVLLVLTALPSLLMLSTPVLALEDTICESPRMTDINQCAAEQTNLATKQMQHYLEESYNINKDNPNVVESIKASQLAWEDYMNKECDSVYTLWRSGSIRGLMKLSCKETLTQQRTHVLWNNYLTYMDSTPPVLPEPNI